MSGITRFNRRLVLMFDGTWNERSNLTNVARMFEAIDDYKPRKYKPESYAGADIVQRVKYLKGVGTSIERVTKYAGATVGFGLSKIIIEGYLWLSNEYREGDEIFVFGFSRGAYSARSLVSLLHRCEGVLMKDGTDDITAKDAAMKDAYAMYQSYVVTTDDHGKDLGDPNLNADFYTKWNDFRSKHRTQPVTVKMLGVWDTVGALGIPAVFSFMDSRHNPLSGKHYEFHDQGLSCIVKNAYHALAIDEHRKPFDPTLWKTQTPENNQAGKEVKQVWFIGSHANVGGGADPYGEDPDDLWQYSYIWMQENARKLGLRFYWKYTPTGDKIDDATKNVPTRRMSLTKTEDSFGDFMGTLYSRFHKSHTRIVNGSNGAKLHWSVKERIEQDSGYRPKSLYVSHDSKILYKQRLDGKPLTGDEKETELEWIEWPIEDEEKSVPSEPKACLPVEDCCSCKKPNPNKTTVEHSSLLNYIPGIFWNKSRMH